MALLGGVALLEEMCHCTGAGGFEVSYAWDTTRCLSWFPIECKMEDSQLLFCPNAAVLSIMMITPETVGESP